MFVSIALDPGSEGRAKELADLLGQYGFEKIQRGLWESAFVSPETLTRLKKDLDRATDAFDRLRIFQFPMEGTLALTSLREKKWRRMMAKGVDAQTPAVLLRSAPQAGPRPARPQNTARGTQAKKPALRQTGQGRPGVRGPAPRGPGRP